MAVQRLVNYCPYCLDGGYKFCKDYKSKKNICEHLIQDGEEIMHLDTCLHPAPKELYGYNLKFLEVMKDINERIRREKRTGRKNIKITR